MARLFTSGAEWNDFTADNVSTGGATPPTFSTTNPRTGIYAYRKASVTGAGYIIASVTTVTVTNYYARCYYNLSALPAAGDALRLMTLGTPTAIANSGVWIAEDGSINIGTSVSATTTGRAATAAAGTWFRLECRWQIDTGSASNGQIEVQLNGVQTDQGIVTGTIGATLVTQVWMGVGATVTAASSGTLDLDDIAVNDPTAGGSQTSWPGSGNIVLLKPISLNTNGGSWTDDNAATTSAALTNAIDNSPPKGIADTTAGGGDHQVRNAGANTNLDMNLTTYSTAGVGASDTINVLTPMCVVGAPVSTGAKSGSFGITSNPAITNRAFTGGSGTATFFWRGAAAGTYPSNWGWERGTTTYAPSVTVGTSPVARLSITGGTTSRVAMCCDLGMYVDYTPATPKSLVADARRVQRNILLRR